MKIDPHQTIGGQPIRAIRDLLRFVAGSEFAAGLVIDRIGVDVTEQLVTEGLIEPCRPFPGEEQDPIQFYRVTTAGYRLALARFNRRIPRRTAERILAAFLARVAAVNADPDLLLRVVEVHAFGSFITDAPDLGDVDLAVRLERKSFPGRDWVDVNLERARRSGRCLNFLQRLYFGQSEVMKRLQNRSAYLSLHASEDLEELGCAHRRIYPPAPSRDVPSQPAPRRHRSRPTSPRRRILPASRRAMVVRTTGAGGASTQARSRRRRRGDAGPRFPA